MKKANQNSKADYLGQLMCWFAADNPREQIVWQWLQDQKTAGVKLAPLVKDILYQHIMGQGANAQVAEELAALRSEIQRAIKSGKLVYDNGEPPEEDADDLLAALQGIQT